MSDTMRLRCWYEGDRIIVGSNYEYHDVFVYIIYPDGEIKLLDTKDITFPPRLVEHEGWNWYTISYRINHVTLTSQFVVPGYIPIEHPNRDFCVKRIVDRDTYETIDYTEQFEEVFTTAGMFLISWTQFLKKVNQIGKYGMYILTAPKLSGLSNEYDQIWSVLCINKTTLKATVIKTFYKEED